MALIACISPQGHVLLEQASDDAAPTISDAIAARILRAFERGQPAGLLHLATAELQSTLPDSLSFPRELARAYLTQLCHLPQAAPGDTPPPLPVPDGELEAMSARVPPMKGAEYVSAAVLREWWETLDAHVRAEAAVFPGGLQQYLRDRSPLWRMVGRVTFHLAENKRDELYPFAFMATYVTRLSAQARLQHLPLGKALQEYAGAKNRSALLSLLTPIQRAAEKSALAKELVESKDVYHPLAWSPRQAHRFLQEIPIFEESGIVVRVPDWWKAHRPPRPQVNVTVGEKKKSGFGADSLLDFNVTMALDGQSLSAQEIQSLLNNGESGLVRLRGQWIEIDRDRLQQALDHWKGVERQVRDGGVSFAEAMRMLSGANIGAESPATDAPPEVREWSGIAPGAWLDSALAELRDPQSAVDAPTIGLRTQLRPYQQTGANWLAFMTRLGLGACLADDMGLGKTIQMLALLLYIRREQPAPAKPSLLIVPASLVANWKAEIARFAPDLHILIAHPSEDGPADLATIGPCDLVITTYGMLVRMESLRQRNWNLVILDEAQAIKNAGTRQSKAVKALAAAGRIALTGTPVENRLGDLWSLFDFLNPGLLGSAKAFGDFIKHLSAGGGQSYAPLRSLVRPYILRRLKTDKSIIADLPEKVEMKAFCSLTAAQAAAYQQAVAELREKLSEADGIQRRGVVLAYLMRFKQICNHPSQWTGDGVYAPGDSGKFDRLRQICDELAQRQEKALIFTQFREITAPLTEFLQGVFGRAGLVLHGQTPVAQRRGLVEAFAREDGPPFFVLSLKAGGTGLNLTAASHVIHFDRWWNPAVESQATDRAFRIGQKKNVMVHKFVCRGTVEEKIDELIAEKTGLARGVLEEGAEKLLTEMSNEDLLRFVALDVHKAVES